MRTDPIVRKHAAEPSVRGLKVFGLGLALMWLLLDQATKWWILEYASALTEPLHVTSFFNVVLGWNRGISFGMLGGHELPPWTLALLSGSIAVALIVWLLRTPDRLIATGLALIIGGALGNASDRIRHGAVVDFLDFHLEDWHWPAFNIADVGVVCGAALLILESFAHRDREAT